MGKRSEGEKRLFCRRGPVIQDRQIGDVVRQQARQGRGQTPLPVGTLGAGGVDAGFGTEVEILSPPSARQEMQRMLTAAAQLYAADAQS